MVPHPLLKVQYRDESFRSHVVLIELYKMINTRFETECNTWRPSLMRKLLL